jgi:RNA polymerase sigma factor (TIGR02999 family)
VTDDSKLPSLIAAAGRGQADADALFADLYAELHRLARRELSRQGPASTLGVTTLLHEAYLDMAGREEVAFEDRGRFMGYAARVMRGLIIDHLRERQAQKRGGRFEFTAAITDLVDRASNGDARRLGDALEALDRVEPALAEVVDLKFFCGFSFVEIAAIRGVSERTVQRQWEKARLYLHRSLAGADAPPA